MESTKKISRQEGVFLSFFRLLMTADLLLIKNALTPLAKNDVISLELMTAVAATVVAI